MKKLTLLIPANKEAESLPKFLNELINYDYKKMVVLQKEDEDTINSIKDFKDVELVIQKKKGYGNALIEGLEKIKTRKVCNAKMINILGFEIENYRQKKFGENEFFFDYQKKEIKEKRKMGHLTIVDKKSNFLN